MENRTFSDIEASGYLGLRPQTLRNYRHLGRGPVYVRLGRRIVYLQKDLDKFLEINRIDPEGPQETRSR